MTNKSWLMFLLGSIIIIAVAFAANRDIELSQRPAPTTTPITVQSQPLIATSHPQASPVDLANPASLNCKDKGGELIIQKRGDGGEYGLCMFEDAYACEEWALFRGECPVGGVRTTGYDTVAQKYCAWSGGQTFADPHANCTFPDGSVCSDEEFFNGSCQKGKAQ